MQHALNPATELRKHKLFAQVIVRLARLKYAEQVQLAKQTKVSYPTLYNWVHGDVTWPSTRTLFAVAEGLGLELSWVQRRGKPRLYRVK